jgi:hypothetical protein
MHYVGLILRFSLITFINVLFEKKEKYSTKQKQNKKKLRGFRPQSELYRPSDRRLSAKLVSTLADRGCHVVSATNPHGR